MLFLTTSGPLLLSCLQCPALPPYHTLINPLWLGLQLSAGLPRLLQPPLLTFVATTGELCEAQAHDLQSGHPDRLLTVISLS